MSKKTKDSNGAPPVMDPPKEERKIHPLDQIKFTAIEGRIIHLMKDGQSHTRQEIWGCLEDTEAPLTYIYNFVTNIRKKINPLGMDLRCQYGNLYTLGRWEPLDYV